MASGQHDFPIPYSYSFDSFTSALQAHPRQRISSGRRRLPNLARRRRRRLNRCPLCTQAAP
ncbi:hypothetical protein ABTJ37_21050, partial [Acinetobacter baumannii]